MRYRTRWMAAPALAVLVAAPALGQLEDKVADRFWESTKLLEELVNAPDGGIPQSLLEGAECVGVIPGVVRAAFGFGGQYGRGLVVCRTQGGEGPWGSPSMLSLGGGSFGFQIGGQSTDVLMLFMTPESMRHLLSDELTLGADASASAGPVGRSMSAATSATLRAEILTYARSRGLFAGIALDGAVLRPDDEANASLYGYGVSAETLLLDGTVAVPPTAGEFIRTLTAYSSREPEPAAQ